MAVVSDFVLLFVTFNKSIFTTYMTFSSFIVIALIFLRKIMSAGSLYFLMRHISRRSSSLCNIVVFALRCVSHQFPFINSIVKAFYVVAKRAGNMFLILFSITLFWISDSFKICVYYKGNPHRIIQVIKFVVSLSPVPGEHVLLRDVSHNTLHV